MQPQIPPLRCGMTTKKAKFFYFAANDNQEGEPEH